MTPECVNAYVYGNKLRILRRTPEGELVASSVHSEYAFFVRKEDEHEVSMFRRSRTVRNEGDFVRVVCNSWEERDRIINGESSAGKPGLAKRGVKTYEGDLNPVKRWLVDSGAKIQKPKPGYFDLEIDSRVPFAELGKARCLCWGLAVPQPDGTIERRGGVLQEDTVEAERELLLDLFFELTFVDQALAWNGDRFDFVYLKERCEKLNLGVDLRRWLFCDHMELFAKLNVTASESGDEKASLALDRVAKSLGVTGKLRENGSAELAGVRVGGGKTWEFWAAGGRNRELLLEYCVEDAATMVRIEEKTGYVATLATVAETTGVLADSKGFRGVNYVESFMLRLGAEDGLRAPTKTYNSDDGNSWADREQFKGAYVFPSKKGLHADVHICDFARLYPSIMQAWNMSPETHIGQAMESDLEAACAALKDDEAVAPITLQKFRVKGKRGLFAKALDVIVEQRKYWSKKKLEFAPGSPEWKECDRKDQAYKIVANTFYGVVGSIFSRYFLKEVSESVTQIGAWLIKMTVAEGGKWKRILSAIFGDTDSGGMVGCTKDEFSEFVEYCNTVVYPKAVSPTGADPKLISLAFEKSFSWMINVEKKTYAGRLLHFKGKEAKDDTAPVIKGLEYKRGDSARLARDMQEEIVKAILFTGKPAPAPNAYPLTPKDLEVIIKRWQELVLGAGFEFEDAVMAQRMTKNITSYGGTRPDGQALPIPAHVRVAAVLAERGIPIYAGVKIEYVVTDGSVSPQKVKPAIDATINDIDLFHVWESEVWPATERVVQACFPEHKWKFWGAVRPINKGRGRVLAGQGGFGFGERAPLVKKVLT